MIWMREPTVRGASTTEPCRTPAQVAGNRLIMFGLILGRNVQTETISNPQMTGGWSVTDARQARTKTKFPLSFFLSLVREITVYINGAIQNSSPEILNGGNGYGDTVLGTLTYTGDECSVPPVINVRTNHDGQIEFASTRVQGVCVVAPATKAASWRVGGLLPDGTGAEIRAATYTTDTNGMGITFTTAPVNGAAISAVYYTYGGVGLEADCGPVTSTACGGSGVSSYNFLSWSDDIYIRNMSMSFDNGVADAGAQTCITLDGTNRLAQFTATGLYWCLAQIKAKNNALGIVFNGGVTVVQPALSDLEGQWYCSIV